MIRTVHFGRAASSLMMNRFTVVVALRSQSAAAAAAGGATAAGATAAAAEGEANTSNQQQNNQSEEKTKQEAFQSSALGHTAEGGKKRNIIVMCNTTKAVYIHRQNHIASWYWFITDFHKWFVGFMVLFVGSQIVARYRIAKMQTTIQAQLGENLLDQRTRDLLSDIEQLRAKDPLRLENEANLFHEQFWQRRAKSAAERNQERRNVELTRGILQGEARGTDMTEWLGAKAKDDQEREVARRTQEYIQGFHQHLKAKRLI